MTAQPPAPGTGQDAGAGTSGQDELDRVRQVLAAERQAAGRDAPTLGRLFDDTPGVAHTGDRPPGAAQRAARRWGSEDR